MNRKRLAAALAYVDEKAKRLTSLDQPKESDAVDMALEMGGSFIPGVGQALAARDFERARRAGDEAGMGMAAASALPVGRLIGALKGFDPVMREINVYHGSPHRFEEFDASKIGTGEGAQAYGHGIYLAESPDVAKSYATMDSPFAAAGLKGPAATVAALAKIDGQGNPVKFLEDNYESQVKKFGKQDVDAAIASLKRGNLYTADLPDEMVDRMLDWDKPLSEQPALLKTAEKLKNDYLMWDEPVETATGRDLYEALEAQIGSKEAAAVMKGLKIPGIRYLDAGSRGQGGSGTRNFVVFPGEEKKVKILRRE